MIGDQLPCRTAWTIELIATTATAKPVITYINRAHELMTGLRSVKHPCHRQANLTPDTCQASLSPAAGPGPLRALNPVGRATLPRRESRRHSSAGRGRDEGSGQPVR